MSLCDGLHLVGGHLTTFCHTLTEQLIAAVDIGFQYAHLLSIERTGIGAESTVGVGLHLVELHTQFLRQQFAGIREHTEDTDATGKCCRFCHNPVGWCTDIIAAGSRHTTH